MTTPSFLDCLVTTSSTAAGRNRCRQLLLVSGVLVAGGPGFADTHQAARVVSQGSGLGYGMRPCESAWIVIRSYTEASGSSS